MGLREVNKRGGEPIIEPLRDKKTGKTLTNIQIIRNMDKVLTTLKESKNEEDQLRFAKMTNSDPDIYNYIHEVAAIKDDTLAQKRLAETLIPNPALAAQLKAKEEAVDREIKLKKRK